MISYGLGDDWLYYILVVVIAVFNIYLLYVIMMLVFEDVIQIIQDKIFANMKMVHFFRGKGKLKKIMRKTIFRSEANFRDR